MLLSTPPPSKEKEEGEPLFDDYTFFIDNDVNEEVVDFVRREGAKIVSELPSERQQDWVWLVNQKYIRVLKDDVEKPRVCRVVLQNWVNMCMVKKQIVDIRPFLLSSPIHSPAEDEEEQKPKRGKAALYTKAEDDKLWQFEKDYNYKEWTQEKLWEHAVKKGLLPGRTAISMQRRYRDLKQERKIDKTNQHFSKENDLSLLRWAWCWHNLQRADPTGVGSIWEAAQKKNVVFERKASQMEARYWRVVKKHGGVKNALEVVVEWKEWTERCGLASSSQRKILYNSRRGCCYRFAATLKNE